MKCTHLVQVDGSGLVKIGNFNHNFDSNEVCMVTKRQKLTFYYNYLPFEV